MPRPPPIRRQFFLSFALASSSRGNQESGTEIARPSASATWMSSFPNETSTASGCTSAAEIDIDQLLKDVSEMTLEYKILLFFRNSFIPLRSCRYHTGPAFDRVFFSQYSGA